MTDTLIRRLEGKTVILEINRPDDRNRIDMVTMDALIAEIGAIDRDRTTRSLVITGRGEDFCCGGRIGGFPGGTLNDTLEYAKSFVVMTERLGRCRVPVVAAVNGTCIAGGMSLLDACDLAVAVDTAEFAYPEIEHGLFPLLAMAVARRRLPSKLAFDMFYNARRLDAAEALALHLVNETVPASELWPAVRTMVAALEARSAGALMVGRQAYYAMGNMSPSAALEHAQTALIASLRAAAEEAPTS